VGDFHEDDYYYLNNGDGTFLKAKKSILGIPAGFYGCCVADIMMDLIFHPRHAS
jgi:hypothetical protein